MHTPEISIVTDFPCHKSAKKTANSLRGVLSRRKWLPKKIHIITDPQKATVFIPGHCKKVFTGDIPNRTAAVVDHCQTHGSFFVEHALIKYTENL